MRCSPIVELRQYTLLPGKRDELIDLFEAQFVESQEECGAKIIGTFRDLDDPTKFVWLRGFSSIEVRARSLGEFYGGAAWKRHREAANATMVDSDDVLLLQPAWQDAAFALPPQRPPIDPAGESDRGVVEATILALSAPADQPFLDALQRDLASLLAVKRGALLGAFITCEAENNFPALPVRTGEHVAVWFEAYPTRASYYYAYRAAEAELAQGCGAARFVSPPHVLRLEPTRRSLLTGLAVQAETPLMAGEAR